MYALSLTGGPKRPVAALALVLVVVLFALVGCADRQYREVPQCEVVQPPNAEKYLAASPDEQTVMMTSAYIGQVKAVRNCNTAIDLINARNKAVPSD